MGRRITPSSGMLDRPWRSVFAAIFGALLGLAEVNTAGATIGCSRDGGTPTTIDIDNETDTGIVVYWVSTQCEEVPYLDIAPGQIVRQQTFAGHVWRVRPSNKRWILREATATSAPLLVRIGNFTAPRARSDRNRAADFDGYQIHSIYALPSDGTDRGLDLKGVIARAVATADRLFVRQTGGPRLRWDTHEGGLDVSFVRLRRSSAELRNAGVFIRDEIEDELRSRDLIAGRNVYLVFYDGDSGVATCGGAAWPPTLRGQVAALYLQGTPPGAMPCADNQFATNLDSPGYWEFSIIHEILHTLGFVASCAPNHALEGHVSGDPSDIMYAGPLPWRPSTLDAGRNDYYGHRNMSCLDLARSVFIDPLPTDALPPPGWSR